MTDGRGMEKSKKSAGRIFAIKKGKINANLTSPVLTESYKHLCVAKGKQYA